MNVSTAIWCAGGGVTSDGRVVSVGGWAVKGEEGSLGGGVRVFVEEAREGVKGLVGEWKEDAKTMFLQQPRWGMMFAIMWYGYFRPNY